MAYYEVLLSGKAPKKIFDQFKTDFAATLKVAKNKSLAPYNENTDISAGQKSYGFELSDLIPESTLFNAFESALRNIPSNHQASSYIRGFLDKTGDEEFYLLENNKLKVFRNPDDFSEHMETRKSSPTGTDSKIVQIIESHQLTEFSLLRIKTPKKRPLNAFTKILDEILSTTEPQEKDRLFCTGLDELFSSGMIFCQECWENGPPWRERLHYLNGNVGTINFLDNVAAYEVGNKFITLLLNNAPYEKAVYIPFICGLHGIFGDKIEIKIWSKNANQTRILWHYEDNIMGPTKDVKLDLNDWSYDSHQSIKCDYFEWQ